MGYLKTDQVFKLWHFIVLSRRIGVEEDGVIASLSAVDPGEHLFVATSDVWGPISVQIAASDYFKGWQGVSNIHDATVEGSLRIYCMTSEDVSRVHPRMVLIPSFCVT